MEAGVILPGHGPSEISGGFPYIRASFFSTMANTGDVSVGSFIRFNNDICQVVEWQHRTPGNLRAFYQGKMRNLRTGKLLEHRFRSGENMDVLRVEVRDMQYLYRESDFLVCMDPTSYEQVHIPIELFGDALGLMKEEAMVQVGFESGTPILARPPKVVELEVTYTETAVKGDTSNKVMKAATVETGKEIQVPSFVNIGDVVRVDTETGAYMDRAKK